MKKKPTLFSVPRLAITGLIDSYRLSLLFLFFFLFFFSIPVFAFQFIQNGNYNAPAVPKLNSWGKLNKNDFNDFVVINNWGNSFSVFLNNGTVDGTFSNAGNYPSTPDPDAVFLDAAIIDFNGDTAQDIAVLSDSMTGLVVKMYVNDGSGSFSTDPANDIPINHWAGFMKTGDFNQDHRVDIAIGDSTVLTKNRDIGFTVVDFWPGGATGQAWPLDSTVNDFNGDTFPDLAVLYQNEPDVCGFPHCGGVINASGLVKMYRKWPFENVCPKMCL